MVIPGKFATNYYICQGLDPKMDQYDVDKVKNYHNLKNCCVHKPFFTFPHLVSCRDNCNINYNRVSIPKYQGL